MNTEAYYFFIIDGEVVWKQTVEIKPEMEMVNAIFSSDPKCVRAPDELAKTIRVGWKYDGTNFIPPA